MDLKEALLKVKGENIVIAMHVGPDADAIASAHVLLRYFQFKYPEKPCYIVSDREIRKPFPEILKSFGNVIKEEEIPKDSSVFVVDHNNSRVSLLENGNNTNIKDITIIDHHYEISGIGLDPSLAEVEIFKFIDTSKLSTCEYLFDYLKTDKDFQITSEIATYLYLGIFSDSLLFSRPFKSNLLRKISELDRKYKADIDGCAKYCQGREIYYKYATGGIFNEGLSGDKNTQMATLKVDYSNLQKYRPSRKLIFLLTEDLLCSRDIQHSIIYFEQSPGSGEINFSTRIPNLVKKIFKRPAKDFCSQLGPFTFEECCLCVDKLKGKIMEGAKENQQNSKT